MAHRPAISVVVPTRNGAARLPLLFAALERQTLSRDQFEVVVVDDGSTDETAAVIDSSSVARRISATKHGGRAHVSNLGVTEAVGAIVAFTDDDTVPHAEWLERGLAAMGDAPDRLVAGRIELLVGPDPTTAELVDLGRRYLDQAAMVAEGYAATANLFASRQLVVGIGGFREIWSGGDQDRDLVERARLAGGTLRYEPTSVVGHPARATVRELLRKEYRLAYGAAELRHFSVGEVSGKRQVWRIPRMYLPWRHRLHFDYLTAEGHDLPLGRRAQVWLTQYLCLQLAQIAGSYVGDVRSRRRKRRAS